MDFVITYILIPLLATLLGSGGVGIWLTRVFSTKMEKQNKEAMLISSTISEMLKTIDNLMLKYTELQNELLQKSEQLLRKEIENAELITTVEGLKKEIAKHKKRISDLQEKLKTTS